MFLKNFKYFSTYVDTTEVFFNRIREKTALLNTLKKSPQITLISGGNDTGKSTLINNVLYNEIPQSKLNLIHINLRKYPCNTADELNNALKKSIPENFNKKIGEALPDYSVKSINTSIGSVEFYNEAKQDVIIDLSNTLIKIESAIPNSSIWKGRLVPVLFIDEANELKNLDKSETGKLALKHLINWIVKYTKETPKIHVILGTSDSFFVYYIGNRVGDRCRFMTIGDVDFEDANNFFNYLCDSSNQPKIKKELNFKNDIYDYVGGRLYLIKRAFDDYTDLGVKCINSTLLSSKFSKYREAFGLLKGTHGLVNFYNVGDWENKTLKKYMTLVANDGFANFDETCLDFKELLSMIDNNLFNYRKAPPIYEDVPGLTSNQYPVVVSPSALDHYAIKKIVKNNFDFKKLF
jgi:AAA+ ATPase superfamily predicted ATPase